jgi:hypothetical protein
MFDPLLWRLTHTRVVVTLQGNRRLLRHEGNVPALEPSLFGLATTMAAWAIVVVVVVAA